MVSYLTAKGIQTPAFSKAAFQRAVEISGNADIAAIAGNEKRPSAY
jgi:hypothetical protein